MAALHTLYLTRKKLASIRPKHSYVSSIHINAPPPPNTTATGNIIATCKNSLLSDSNTDNTHITYSITNESNKTLSWYSCGPTVYNKAHLGHARAYICTDAIRRILVDILKVKVNYALGITDIDDKIISAAQYKIDGVSVNDTVTIDDISSVAKLYEAEFFNNMKQLNVKQPDAILRVTEHIGEIINYIKTIINNGYGYVSSDGVYFDVSKCKNYGKLGDVPPDTDYTTEATSNVGIVHHSKRSNRDFVLWKFVKSSLLEPSWNSPWGQGRPGWHIECSAMTHTYFGDKVDIHSGGIDLKFPHHTNEIAQCEAHNNSNTWVRYWLHTGHLYIENRKMSKSLKNFISIDDYMSGNYSSQPAIDLRIYFLQYKYNTNIHFSTDRIREAEIYRLRCRDFLTLCTKVTSTAAAKKGRSICCKPNMESKKLMAALMTCQDDIGKALKDDFDTPTVLNSISNLISDGTRYCLAVLEGGETNTYPLEVLISTSYYIENTLDQLGIQVMVPNTNCSDTTNTASNDNDAVIDEVVEFRNTIRNLSLQGLKNIKASGSSGSSNSPTVTDGNKGIFQDILQSCDDMRSRLDGYGIKVMDMHSTSICRKK